MEKTPKSPYTGLRCANCRRREDCPFGRQLCDHEACSWHPQRIRMTRERHEQYLAAKARKEEQDEPRREAAAPTGPTLDQMTMAYEGRVE